MISKNPENIIYVSVSDTYFEGETVETVTETEIKCTVQNNSQGLKVTANGSDIIYKYQIIIFDKTEIDKLQNFSIDDKIIFSGKEYKVISARKRQYHVEIYV